MFPTSRNSPSWHRLHGEDDKENLPIDFNTTPYFPSTSHGSLSSSGYGQLQRTPSTIKDPRNNRMTYAIPTYLNGFSDSFEPLSPISSGYGGSAMMIDQLTPPAKADFSVFQDQLSSSFDSLLKPFQSYSLGRDDTSDSSTSPPSIPYSPLSSFNFAEVSKLPSAFYSDFDLDFPSPSTSVKNDTFLDEIRRDFEMNGRTVEVEEKSFTPSVSSTPMLQRRSGQWRNANSEYEQQDQRLARQQSIYVPSRVWTRSNKKATEKKRKFKPNKKSLDDHCVFCKNNGEDERVYRTHTVKDAVGRVLCPTLRQYKCPICGEDGDKSHTVKYCPKKPIITLEDIERMEKIKC